MADILIVDDEESICWALSKLGTGLGHRVQTAPSAEDGLAIAGASPVDLLILDVRLPGIDGLSAIERFRAAIGDAPIVVMTAFGDLETAVKAIRCGAFEYLLKPFDLAEVRTAIERALRGMTRSLPVAQTESQAGMIGETPVMQSLFKRIAQAAASDANVTLRGESGAGKELAAHAVHRYSPQAEGPFVAVNLAALSPTVAESELFGHTDGAFTGAVRTRAGLLSQADGGTLFLDEVAEMPLTLQVKLLRAIEQGEVLPVGADRPIATRFRVVAATHRDLKAMVRAGEFRHDLYFRLCAFEVQIPALRERPDDIPLLANNFASRLRGGRLAFAEETVAELKRRPWYGNVRELRNAVEHAAVLAQTGVMLPEHLPDPQPRFDHPDETTRPDMPTLASVAALRSAELLDDPEAAGSVYETLLREVEAPLIANAMERFDNECAPAARVLGLHRTTLRRKLTQHGVDPRS